MFRSAILIICFIPDLFSTESLVVDPNTILTKDNLIFSSPFDIIKVLVPSDGNKLITASGGEVPTVFFTVADPASDGGSCVYVLEGLAAYEIVDGGRDITSDYGNDSSVYIGSHNGIYKFSRETTSAKKYGIFRDNIVQLQKAKNEDTIYILDIDNKIFAIQNNGTVKSRLTAVTCATEFVLDTSDNLYFLDCEDNLPGIVLNNGKLLPIDPNALDSLYKVRLVRPALMMENCVPLFANGSLYLMYSNGTVEDKDFNIVDNPTAISIDTGLYIAVAMNKKLYEFNLMDMLLKSMFGVIDVLPIDLSKIIMSVLGISNTNISGIAIV